MTKLRTGLIGCGRVAHLHAASLQKLDSSLFTAVCSRNRQRSTNFGKQYSVSAFTDVEEMIDRSKLDMVIICTPHPFHAFPAVTAANAVVHVLVEKPLASSLKDCDAMIYAADKAGVLLGTMSQRRWYAPVQRVKKALLDGKLGMPILGTVTMYGWRDKKYYDSDDWRGTWNAEGGGVLVNQAPHQLDLLQWYMGPIDQLFGYWDNLNHPYIEVEDTAIAVLRFKNGALGNIVVSNSQNPALFGKVTVFGGNGACASVQTDGGAMFIAGMSSIAEPPYNDLWTIAGEEKMLEIWKQQDADFFNGVNPMEYYHQQQISDFLEAILQNREPEVTGREGRKTVEIFTAVYRSQRDKRPVQFPLLPESDR